MRDVHWGVGQAAVWSDMRCIVITELRGTVEVLYHEFIEYFSKYGLVSIFLLFFSLIFFYKNFHNFSNKNSFNVMI